MTTKDKKKSFQNKLIKIFQRGYNQPKIYGHQDNFDLHACLLNNCFDFLIIYGPSEKLL